MRIFSGLILTCGLVCVASHAVAQRTGGGRPPASDSQGADDFVAQMMAFDKDKDGKITEEEVTDQRLLRLFARADANKDGTVTKAELTTLAAQEPVGGREPGGPGGPGRGMGGPPPRPGEILSPGLQDRLELSDDQRDKLDVLQKEVDAKLNKILNAAQKTQLNEMKRRGPGGPPGGGGRRGGGESPPPPPID